MLAILTLCLVASFSFGCGDARLPQEDIVKQIQRYRVSKDISFKKDYNSPIPEPVKARFRGLEYYPVNLKYRLRLPLHKYPESPPIEIVTSAGTVRQARKYGYFEFEMESKPCTLQVYKLLDTAQRYPRYLFLPFMDLTTGKETYAGGRYLDFEENESDIYDVDFNLAYNPLCAYGKPGYNCPIPPAENRLEVPIRAGEKDFHLANH